MRTTTMERPFCAFQGFPKIYQIPSSSPNLPPQSASHRPSPLNRHLHNINRADSPTCPSCGEQNENVFHFLMECPSYAELRDRLRRKMGRDGFNLGTLLSNKAAFPHLFFYIHETKRFQTF